MHDNHTTKHIAYLGLGSNLDDRLLNLQQAIDIFREHAAIKILAVSEWMENPAIEEAGPQNFLNGVVKIHTSLNPQELLALIQAVENAVDPERIGRGRKKARKLDIDILLYGDLVINEGDLQIPHPRMADRDFVMKPLASLRPNHGLLDQAAKNVLRKHTGLILRPMYLGDLDQVMIIDRQVFGDKHWTREIFVQELANLTAIYFVLELDKQVVAYIGAWMIIDEMHIMTLATDPKFQRRGFAELLLIQLINKAIQNNIASISLEVRLSNIAAQGLYGKYHFQHQGIRKKYYEDNGESALILWTENIQEPKFQDLFLNQILQLT